MTKANVHKPMSADQVKSAVGKVSHLVTPDARKDWQAIGVLPILDEERVLAAERVYEDFRFNIAPEAASGWEWVSGQSEFRRVLFLPNGDEATVKGSFGVRFRPDSADAIDVWSLDQHGQDNGTPRPDWYSRRNELQCDQVFTRDDNSLVKLDSHVPGDATKWYVATWSGGSWGYYDDTIEPGDLVDLVEDPALSVAAQQEPPQP